MKKARSISKVFTGNPTIEGAGVHLRRFFSQNEVTLFDPFLLLDDFSSQKTADYIKGFPWHPHRGIETITYVLAGTVEHGDSIGNHGSIEAGDVQWMTAGSGIIHQEMPRGDGKKNLCGFQLWANLPADQKMIDPHYRGVNKNEIPTLHASNKSIYRIIAGQMDGTSGPVRGIAIDPVYFDITIPPGNEFVYPTSFDHTFFAYVFDGKGRFGAYMHPNLHGHEALQAGTLALYSPGDFISIATEEEAVRFLLIGGKPLHEPVAWYGPIVMNTDEQLKKAFEEFQVGTFLKHSRG